MVAVAVAALTATSVARAEEAAGPEDAEFDALLARAVEAYNAQRYEQAVQDFQRAYEMRPQPEIIYNIARIYERSVQREQAIEQYQRFLSLPNTTSDLRARAATALESLRTEMAAIERANRPQNDPNNPNNDPNNAQNPTGPTTPTQPVRPRTPASVLAGWILVGLGGATLVGGVAMGALALTEQTATNEAGSLAEYNEHNDLGSTYALTADILFGAGGALAIGGIVALVIHAVRSRNAADEADDPNTPYPDQETTDEEADDRATSMIFSPYLGQNGLGFTLGGRF
jgi:tetratricopeptide (TPR) repeat protein